MKRFKSKAWVVATDGKRHEHVAFGNSPRQCLTQTAAWLRGQCWSTTCPAYGSEDYGYQLFDREREISHIMVLPYVISHFVSDSMEKVMDDMAPFTGCRNILYYPNINTHVQY